MRSVRVIPCLDIKSGEVVKGVNFEGLRSVGDPVTLANYYNQQGADELVFLDIGATHEARAPVIDLAERVGDEVFIPFTVGGGIRTIGDIRDALMAGADKVSLNSSALADPNLVRRAAERFGSQCIVVAIDARRAQDRWNVYSRGGRQDTGQDAVEWARWCAANGAGEILLTSMDSDGTLSGYDVRLTRAVADAVDVPVIASGGGGTPQHLVEAVLDGHADAVLVASIVHDGTHRISDLKASLASAGLPVRTI